MAGSRCPLFWRFHCVWGPSPTATVVVVSDAKGGGVVMSDAKGEGAVMRVMPREGVWSRE